jgi:hypothetical protein
LVDAPQNLAHSLVPLRLAAELVWAKVYQGRSSAAKDELLNSIAFTFSLLTTIYEYEPESRSPARELSRAELDHGIFVGGAEELQFRNGRPPRRFLAIAADDISKAIEALKGSA